MYVFRRGRFEGEPVERLGDAHVPVVVEIEPVHGVVARDLVAVAEGRAPAVDPDPRAGLDDAPRAAQEQVGAAGGHQTPRRKVGGHAGVAEPAPERDVGLVVRRAGHHGEHGRPHARRAVQQRDRLPFAGPVHHTLHEEQVAPHFHDQPVLEGFDEVAGDDAVGHLPGELPGREILPRARHQSHDRRRVVGATRQRREQHGRRHRAERRANTPPDA